MVRQIITVGTCLLLLASCDSRITDSKSYSSPDGKLVITVVEELQGANDPAPWWTHVSLRENGDELKKIPGNILMFDGRGAVTAAWNGDKDVTIFIDDTLFPQVSATKSEKYGVQIGFRKASTRIETNSKQDAGGQPATRPETK
jgi:hypothetical protein